MRAFRLAIATLIAVGLAVLPMSAGVAMASATDAEMSMGAADEGCPCCDTAPDRAAGIGNPSCCAAILAGEQPLPTPRCAVGADMAAARLPQLALPPDPPPPRS